MRHYLWMVVIALVVSGCASQNSARFEELFEITEKRSPVLEISDREYEWNDRHSYASNIIEISGGQYGLFDGFNAENAHVEATTAGRVGWAAFNWLSGSNVLETASLDSVRAKNSKDAEFNPFIMLFVDETELNEGLANATPVEYLRGKLEAQLQLAVSEFHDNSTVEVLVYNAVVNDFSERTGIRMRMKENSVFWVQIYGEACSLAVDGGYIVEPYASWSDNLASKFSVYTTSGLLDGTTCGVYVSAESLGWQVLPWSDGVRTHAFKIETSQNTLSEALATWVPSTSATKHLTWVVGNRWYAGTKYMRSQFPFVTGGDHAWLFTVGNDSIPLDDFQKMTGQTE